MDINKEYGEWKLKECSNGGVIVELGKKDQSIQVIDVKKAKLIVASPQLLKASIELIRVEDRIGSNFPTECMDAIRRAIEQATETK